MLLDEFCEKIHPLGLSQSRIALCILWFHDEKQPDIVMSPGEMSRVIHNAGLGNPHSTQLGESVKKSGLAIQTSAGFKLKVLARSQIREWLLPVLGPSNPPIDQELGYLPQDVWKETRGYIERVCEQLNGCYQMRFFDAASVMMRRLVETLLIEAYEAKCRESEVKDGSGNYFMLRDLIDRTLGMTPLGVGRDAGEALRKIKELGDRSAHNRRYNAVKADLDKIQSGLRVLVDELINLASLRRTGGKA